LAAILPVALEVEDVENWFDDLRPARAARGPEAN
jgi:hypothetical protein